MPLLETEAPELDVKEWLNAGSHDISEGVYLIDFRRQSCHHCIERMKQVQEIHENYPLTVIGIHSPEFSFEKDTGKTRKQLQRQGIDHPVGLDSGERTWKRYGNSFSPRRFIVVDGRIKAQYSGENLQPEIERRIADATDSEHQEIIVPGKNYDASGDIYLGYNRCSNVNEEGNFRGEKELETPVNRKPERLYLEGVWKREPNFLETIEGSQLYYSYTGSEVGLVVDPGDGIRDIEVFVDGQRVSETDAGKDLRVEDGRSYLRVKEPGLYRALDSDRRESELTLVPEPKTRLYAVTFR